MLFSTFLLKESEFQQILMTVMMNNVKYIVLFTKMS